MLRTLIAILSLGLAACQSDSGLEPTPPATRIIVPETDMVSFCQSRGSERYGGRASSVAIFSEVPSETQIILVGRTHVAGQFYDPQISTIFRCVFDKGGLFLGLT